MAAFEETPLWISHHRADQAHKCVLIGTRHVCRRCVTLYPTLLVATFVASVAGVSGGAASSAMVALCMVPLVADWVAEHAGVVAHSPLRQVAASLVAAIGGGVALAVHLASPFDPWVTVPVATAAAACLISATFAVRATRGTNGADVRR